ncbi:MAG: sigma-70 family RNA polymerase sigma factor [Planctomycetota bacterium]
MTDTEGTPNEDPLDDTCQRLDAWFQGDKDALDELVKEHWNWMRGRARREMGAADRRALESVDVVQTSLARLLRKGPSYAPRSRAEFRALLARVIRSSLLDERDRRHAAKRGDEAAVRLPSQGLSRVVVDGRGRDVTMPADAAARKERARRIADALRTLSDEDAEIMQLRQVEQLHFKDIAERLGLESADAARMRFNRALPRVARRLQEMGLDGDGSVF